MCSDYHKLYSYYGYRTTYAGLTWISHTGQWPFLHWPFHETVPRSFSMSRNEYSSRYLIWGKQNSPRHLESRHFPSPGAQKCWSPAQTLPPVMWLPRGPRGCTLPCQKRQGLQFIGRMILGRWINGGQIEIAGLTGRPGRFVWTCRVHWYDSIYI